jgi:prepilin-type N-terminal cleavage/methylation domain-containing protein
MRQRGFTLTELLIVIAIVVILLLLLLLSINSQLFKGRDARRKADLNRIQKAFEEYLNDKQNYPYAEVLDVCGSNNLSPYIKRVPCDPVTKEPYLYVPGEPLNSGYRVCAKLENKQDPDIERLGCHPDNGCGFGAGYNYCISVGYGVTPEDFNPNLPPTPTPTPTPYYAGNYACTPGGQCNVYDNPAWHGCPAGYAEPTCQNMCGNPANRCDN